MLSSHSRTSLEATLPQNATQIPLCWRQQSPRKKRCSKKLAYSGFPCYTRSTAGEMAWEARLGLKLLHFERDLALLSNGEMAWEARLGLKLFASWSKKRKYE